MHDQLEKVVRERCKPGGRAPSPTCKQPWTPRCCHTAQDMKKTQFEAILANCRGPSQTSPASSMARTLPPPNCIHPASAPPSDTSFHGQSRSATRNPSFALHAAAYVQPPFYLSSAAANHFSADSSSCATEPPTGPETPPNLFSA